MNLVRSPVCSSQIELQGVLLFRHDLSLMPVPYMHISPLISLISSSLVGGVRTPYCSVTTLLKQKTTLAVPAPLARALVEILLVQV